MKLRQLKCPNCKGNIIEKEDGIWMCESCRSIFQDEDYHESEPNEFTYNKNININKRSEKHNYDYADIQRAKTEENKTDVLQNIVLAIIVFGVLIVAMIVTR